MPVDALEQVVQDLNKRVSRLEFEKRDVEADRRKVLEYIMQTNIEANEGPKTGIVAEQIFPA